MSVLFLLGQALYFLLAFYLISNCAYLLIFNPINQNLQVYLLGKDDQVYYNYFDDTWHDWTSNGIKQPSTSIKSIYAVFNPKNKNVEVFLIGTDDKVHYNYFDGTWHNWSPDVIQQPSGKSISAIVNPQNNNNLEVYLLGIDNKVYYNYFDSAWHDWTPQKITPFVGVNP